MHRLIDLPAWWLVPGQPQEVLSWIEAHPPPGSSWHITSSSGTAALTEAWSAGFAWPEVSEVLGARSLVVNVVAAPGGSTALRTDAEDVWIAPRPASEQIPSAARILEVTKVGPGRGALKPVVIERPASVHKVIELINGLSISQLLGPVYSCPDEKADPTTFSLTFRDSRDGPALAEATQSMPVDLCSGMGLTIRGHPQPSLAGAGAVMRKVNALLRGAGR